MKHIINSTPMNYFICKNCHLLQFIKPLISSKKKLPWLKPCQILSQSQPPHLTPAIFHTFKADQSHRPLLGCRCHKSNCNKPLLAGLPAAITQRKIVEDLLGENCLWPKETSIKTYCSKNHVLPVSLTNRKEYWIFLPLTFLSPEKPQPS